VETSELEGFYSIAFHSAENPGEIMAGYYTQAYGVFSGGRFTGRDHGGCLWYGLLNVGPTGQLVGTVAVDPRYGADNAVVLNEKGEAQREPVQYKIALQIHVLAGSVRIEGDVPHGPVTFKVTLKRVAGLNG
jgi:hypothetical protein